MRKTFLLMTVAAFTVGGRSQFVVAAADTANTPPTGSAVSSDHAGTSGAVNETDNADTRGVRHVLARVVDDATNPGKYSDLLMNLSKTDRERMAKSSKPVPDLEAAVTQFQNDWKTKYGTPFSVQTNFRSVFDGSFVKVNGPSIYDDAQAAGTKQTPALSEAGPRTTGSGASEVQSGQNLNGGAPRSAAPSPPSNGTNPNVAGPDTDGSGAAATTHPPGGSNARSTSSLPTPASPSDHTHNSAAAGPETTGSGAASISTSGGKGDVASDATARTTATIPASHGAPAVTVNLVSEDGKLRIDIPDSIDAAQLQSNIAHHLQMLCQDKANWPNDANEASRAVTHHVIMAIVDTSMTK